MVTINYPWYLRGAFAFDGNAGLFQSYNVSGVDENETASISGRVVMIP